MNTDSQALPEASLRPSAVGVLSAFGDFSSSDSEMLMTSQTWLFEHQLHSGALEAVEHCKEIAEISGTNTGVHSRDAGTKGCEE